MGPTDRCNLVQGLVDLNIYIFTLQELGGGSYRPPNFQ